MRLNIWPVSVILEAVDDEQSPNRMKDNPKKTLLEEEYL